VPFWRRLAGQIQGRVLELGCGTGRISLPLARSGVSLVGVDRSEAMLRRADARARSFRTRRPACPSGHLTLVRGDICALPFRDSEFAMVVAPYGVLQSILHDRDLAAALRSVSRVLEDGGIFGLDLVPDVPNWQEYRNRIKLRGRSAGGAHLTLVESVSQNRRRRLTTFEHRFVERRGRRTTEHRFALTFRTLPVRAMVGRLEAAGFHVEAILGDYRGRPWDVRSDVWLILARKSVTL
jgi:SAM-dependent methyltransferase